MVFGLGELLPRMTPAYRETFFERPGIVDKLALIARKDHLCLGLNFYRFADSGAFDPALAGDPLWPLLGQLALLHYADPQPPQVRSPLLSLSRREREICEGILRGLTAEAIAWELGLAAGTVITYRRRAYTKLGIHSKSALFALCRTGG